MKNKISKNENLLNISSYKIDFEKVKILLGILDINTVSIFLDEGYKYSFYKIISSDSFDDDILKLNKSTLIFDGQVTECPMDKEVDTLSNRKIFIAFDLGENLTCILINLKNVKLSKKELKEILK
ncbi:MAG: hypothetical protein IKB75_06610 [Clostridia bacterium]|nr:hypothetical protein [Clostridia bacterium]